MFESTREDGVVSLKETTVDSTVRVLEINGVSWVRQSEIALKLEDAFNDGYEHGFNDGVEL